MKKVFFQTFGCKVNISETESLRKDSGKYGFIVASSDKEADYVIINSCAVTQNAEKKCKDYIKKIKREGKKVILTGCFAKILDEQTKNFVDIAIENSKKEKTLQIVSGEFGIDYEETSNFVEKGKTRAFLKIQDGCDSFCSYCIIPFLRGKPKSIPLMDVIDKIKGLITDGYKEIVLVGIHVGKYGEDIGVNLNTLLKEIVRIFKEEKVRFRLSSLDVHEVDDELIKIVKESEGLICNHFHISLQSGSDKILTKMRRKYGRDDFIAICKKIKKEIPDVRIGSDVIVGFPGETEEDFNETVFALKESFVDFLHVFSFSKRKGTKAYDMPNQIPKKIKSERAKILRELEKEFETRAKEEMVGKKVIILAENEYEGHSENYHLVKVKGKKLDKNEFYKIKIVGFDEKYLLGVCVDE